MGRSGFRYYPAAWSGALTTVLAALVAFKVFPQTTADYVSASGVAILGLVTAVLARPWVVPVISAAFGTFLTSLAGFGLHFSDAQIAAVMGLVTLLGTWFVHSNIVPNIGSPSVLDPQLHPLVHTTGPVVPQVPPR